MIGGASELRARACCGMATTPVTRADAPRGTVTMPTLDEAFESRARGPGRPPSARPPSDFEGLAPFEAMVAVFLTRTLGESSWRAALDGLREAELLTPERLAEAEITEIGDAVRRRDARYPPRRSPRSDISLAGSSSTRRPGAIPCSNPDRSIRWLIGRTGGNQGHRAQAVADAILLYALKRPSYPVDRATYRILVRHGWLDPTAAYEEARDLLVDQVAREAESLENVKRRHSGRLAHGMEQVGRRFCRATAAAL